MAKNEKHVKFIILILHRKNLKQLDIIIYTCENGDFDKHDNIFTCVTLVNTTFPYVNVTYINLIFLSHV